MKSQFVLFSMDGKVAYPINIRDSKKHWDSRKCWYVHCSNNIHVVHLTENNNATHGYCFWCFRDSQLFGCLYGYSSRGKWVECIKDYKTKKPFLKERTDRISFEKILKEKYGCKK